MLEEKDKTYLILVSYLVPVEGTLVVPGKSEEEVTAKALELFQNRINTNIVLVKCLDDSEEEPTQEDLTNVVFLDPTKKKNNNDQNSFPDR